MSKRVAGISLLLTSVLAFNVSIAESGTDSVIKQSLQRVLPDFTPDEISPSPVDGVSEVLVGPRLFYITNDGKYLLQGSLIDLQTRQDLSEERRKTIRLAAVNKLGEENMIIFPAKDPRHTITIFTDVDCGYCRKLHQEIGQYNARGITVRYLMFPRSGINTPSYDKAVSVWCEDDRPEALTRSKAGKQLPAGKCANPVKDHYELGQLIGVQGTPAIILDDGEMLPGYVPADRLAKALDSDA